MKFLEKQTSVRILALSVFVLFVPLFLFAEESTFTPLVGIPGVNPNEQKLSGYIEALYLLSISLAALLAFLKIILAGVQYMMTDVVTTKGEAKKTIGGALLGLLIIIGAVLILETINPTLTNLDALDVDRTIDIGNADNRPPKKQGAETVVAEQEGLERREAELKTENKQTGSFRVKISDGTTNPRDAESAEEQARITCEDNRPNGSGQVIAVSEYDKDKDFLPQLNRYYVCTYDQ